MNPHVNFMMEHDAFSKWLGIKIEEVSPGYCKLSMRIRADMLNGFGIAHGGICFSLADTCLAFAANSHGQLSLTIQAGISWPQSLKEGDELVAESRELVLSEKSASYDVEISRVGKTEPVALFRGLVHRSSKPVIS